MDAFFGQPLNDIFGFLAEILFEKIPFNHGFAMRQKIISPFICILIELSKWARSGEN